MTLNYDPATIQWTDPGEPVEVRLGTRRPTETEVKVCYVLTAWRTEHGTVAHSLFDMDRRLNSLGNLQPKLPFPGKAIPGWQAEFITAALSGIYKIESIR